jgi:hypothetical protein
VKEQILKFFRALTGRKEESAQPSTGPASQAAGKPLAAGQQASNAAAESSRGSTAPGGSAGIIEIPLQKILSGLPPELKPRPAAKNLENRLIQIPLDKVLPQLSRGSVRLTFGELRSLVPDVFATVTDKDSSPVVLPLDEVLRQINPSSISRRKNQRQIQVPAEITSPFDPRAIRPTPGDDQRAGGALPFTPQITNPLSTKESESAPGSGSGKSPSSGLPTQTTPVSSIQRQEASAVPFSANSAGKVPIPSQSPINSATTPAARANGTGGSCVAQFPQPPTGRLGLASAPGQVMSPLSSGGTTLISRTSIVTETHTPAKARFDSAKPAEGMVVVSLCQLAEAWPEPIRKEILEFDMVDTELHIPMEFLDRTLKAGKVTCDWRALRQWMRPPSPLKVSPADAAQLELPLKVMAPLFLTRQKERIRDRKKVDVDKEIPNLFFGFPQTATTQPTQPQAEDTNYFIRQEPANPGQVQNSSSTTGKGSPGTRFIAKYATPNEVVSRAAGLEGVAGALIALPDGLMVASRLSVDVNGDTLAAFLPQIFAKVSQSTNELRMGELNNLNFTVGNIPWKIFRVNAIYFAAFGRAGQPLPTAQLAGLAAELDHNK